MALLRRRKLVCFYCGRRSAKVQDGTVRRWQCTECEAVNHLDEHGEITDPPTTETQAGLQDSPHTSKTNNKTSDDGPFCATCIKNQHLLTTTLADYLPSSTHPDYAKYEASYPKYRANLEERYPQVCADCEPRVRERIRAAGYVAKTDHLRRMMERTRKSGMQRTWYQCGWRGLFVFLGSLTWWASILGQGMWHFLGLMTWQPSDTSLDLDDKRGLVTHCLRRALTGHSVDGTCVSGTLPLLWGAISLGVLSIWWNNQLMKKLRGSGFRLKGLNEYYKLQVVLLAVRASSSWIPRDESTWNLGMDKSAWRGAHAFMIVFLALATIISLRTVSVDRGPRISFPDTNIPLTTGPSPSQSVVKTQNQSGLGSQPNHASTSHYGGTPRFSISKLAPGPNVQNHQAKAPYQSPTPPPEGDENYDDPDAMEWTPTQESFNPARRVNVAEVTASFPVPPFSTFNRLPPAPKGPAAKLRTAALVTQPTLKSHSDQLQNPFQRFPAQASNDRQPVPDRSDRNQMVISPPQFFPASDASASTGLESLFDAAFSIRDEPLEVRAATIEEQTHPSSSLLSSSSSSALGLAAQTQTSATKFKPYINILSIVLRVLALFTWNLSAEISFKLGALGINIISTVTAAIPGIASSYSTYIHILLSTLLTVILALYSHVLPNHLIDHSGTLLFSLMLAQNIRWMMMISSRKPQHPQAVRLPSTDRKAESWTAPSPSISSAATSTSTSTSTSTYAPSLSSQYPPSNYTTRTSTSAFSYPSSSSTWSTPAPSWTRSARTSGTGSYLSSTPYSSTSTRPSVPSSYYSSIPSSSLTSSSSSSYARTSATGSTTSNKTVTPYFSSSLSSSYTPRTSSRWDYGSDDHDDDVDDEEDPVDL
ncbi:MAG: hypothetical protein M1816_007939 [Peltula sp. TS41687]|nr:MAG: hypothetical protein M1816_007939 [Peltula sp. TS41687]